MKDKYAGWFILENIYDDDGKGLIGLRVSCACGKRFVIAMKGEHECACGRNYVQTERVQKVQGIALMEKVT